MQKRGIPLSDDIALFDTFDINKKSKFSNNSEWRVFDYKPMPFPPIENKYTFPKHLYLVFKKKIKDVLFDYIEFGSNVKIVSESFYHFLLDHKMDSGFEKSELTLVNKQGIEVSNKKYYALRFGIFDDDKFDFDEKTKKRIKHGSTFYVFPNLNLKDFSIDKQVFCISPLPYRESLILKADLINKILQNFHDPEIYDLSKFPFIYENLYDEDILPIKNQYRIAGSVSD